MTYNQEIFEQTLKTAEQSTVTFKESVQCDKEILGYSEEYISALLEEPELQAWCEEEAERYYYMVASHSLYAGFCIANWETMEKRPRDQSFQDVMSMDSIAIMRMNWPTTHVERVNWYTSDIYHLAINDFQNQYGQPYIIDNSNEYMQGLLLAFFVIGYNLRPEYFE